MLKFFENTFLFEGIAEKEIERLLASCACETVDYHKDDEIYSPSDYDGKIGFIVTGKCAVCRKKPDSTDVVLNILEKYASFGVLAAFSSEEFPTVVRAMKDSTVAFFTTQEILALISECPKVSINIINFLADRIAFLNKRIATFTCSTVESKLASFILSEHTRLGSLEIPFNCKRVATVINAGRASVYRALETLSDEGAIIYDTKKISIEKLDLIERISK